MLYGFLETKINKQGRGPKQRLKTVPDLIANSPRHQEAIAQGKEYFYSWSYNVLDKFKNKTTEEIRQTLRDTSFPYAILIENLLQDYNISCCIRSANCFNAREIFYVGDKRFDKRGCQGTQNYTDIQWLSSMDDVIELQKRYTFVGCDNIKGSVPLDDYVWPENPLIILGSEGVGLSPMMQGMCKDMVEIPMFGSVRSLNAAAAGSIIFNDFVTKYRKKNNVRTIKSNNS